MENTQRLTSLSHGGGCGCKIAPHILQEILKQQDFQNFPLPSNLLVGKENSDDAAVYQINASQAIVATTDFFMPIVDDPFDFGKIAATNALSDLYAMGATPLFALAIVGMPIDKLPYDIIQKILAGGESVCQSIGIPIAGGHSIDAIEPIYGLVAIGIVDPKKVKKNNQAQPGDSLILTKPLGIGILSGALKKQKLSQENYQTMLQFTTQLNSIGQTLAELETVHSMTDITGFGLLGHLLEMAQGSQLQAQIHFGQIPKINHIEDLIQAGLAPGAVERNWKSYQHFIELDNHILDWQRQLLCDPQTSGGLLISCASSSKQAILETIQEAGFSQAAYIGEFQKQEIKIKVLP